MSTYRTSRSSERGTITTLKASKESTHGVTKKTRSNRLRKPTPPDDTILHESNAVHLPNALVRSILDVFLGHELTLNLGRHG